MSRTVITHPDGSVTTVTKHSGCSGCFWALLVAFLLFAPGAWVSSGSIPLAVGVGMYIVLAVVLIAGALRSRPERPYPGTSR